MERKLIFRKAANWFKFFIALNIFVVSLIQLIITLTGKDLEENELIGKTVASSIGGFIGIILFIWFIKTKKRLRSKTRETSPEKTTLEPLFYLKHIKFIQRLDGLNINGFGTSYLTRNSRQEDGSFLAIKWLTIGFFPFAPLYQERIKINSQKKHMFIPFLLTKTTTSYDVIERVNINHKLVKLTYIFYYLFFLPMLISPIIFLLVFIEWLNSILPGTSFWLLILGYLIWGILLLYLVEVWNQKFF